MTALNPIVLIQQEYLKTENPQLLETLYSRLLSAGRKVQRDHPEVNQDPDIVMDIASSVVLRLLNKQDIVVRSPMSYMRSALYFSNKALWHDSLDDTFEASPATGQNYEQYVQTLLDEMKIDRSTELGLIIQETLVLRLNWIKIAGKLSPEMGREFLAKMEEIRSYVKENMQGSGVY